MAVIQVVKTDALPFKKAWAMPPNPDSLRSPIPRGILTFEGSQAIALKAAGNITDFQLITTLPSGFGYISKSVSVKYVSDDLVNQFNVNGNSNVTLENGAAVSYPFTSPGNTLVGIGTRATKIYVPDRGTNKFILTPSDVVDWRIQDDHADESPAGDIFYFVEFYQFDIQQITEWEVNTPIPIISHTAY